MERKQPNLEAQIEALLFLYGEPVEKKKLATAIGASEEDITHALTGLQEHLKAENRGLALVAHSGRIQLTTKAELGDILARAIEDDLDTGLTPASLEALAIVAYLGPCRRSLIDHIRGVNSSFILRNLLIRGLIERTPDPERSNAYLYQITFDFLRHMGLTSRNELPELDKYQKFKDLFTQDVPASDEIKKSTDSQTHPSNEEND